MSKALYIQCERKLSMKLKRKISRILSMTLAIMMLVPAMCADAFNFTPTSGYDDDGKAIPLELYSEAVYMVNLDSGEAIVDINVHHYSGRSSRENRYRGRCYCIR